MEKIIFMDYGHGGSDSGACANGVVEKYANLTTGLSCSAELRKHGVKVVESRTSDIFVSLDARTNMANNCKADYFVSIHHNAGGGDRGEYIHSVFKGKGLELAESIGSELNAQLGQQKKVFSKEGQGNKDYYHVIRNTNMHAVIVEVCFLDNAQDVQLADTIEEQQRNGIVIAHGILKHLGIGIDNSNNTIAPVPTPPIVVPTQSEKVDVNYQVYIPNRWLANVNNLQDYAGIYDLPCSCVYASCSKGAIKCRVHLMGGNWLPWVKNRNDYAGIYNKPIDGIQFELEGLPEYTVRYRAYSYRWLPWVNDLQDYAGIYGTPISCIQVEIVKK